MVIRVGLIGYGYWGPNLARNFSECEGTTVVAVSDAREDRLAAAARRYPGIRTMKTALDLIRDPGIDAVAIATPVNSHFDLASQALSEGKHVLVEKPMTSSSQEALRLIDLATRKKLVLMVDHTFVYTGAVRKIRDVVRSGEFGELYYYDSVRVNLGLFQYDVNVLWDLAVHDISIMNYVLPHEPVAVSAMGATHVPGGNEDIAYMTFMFESNLIAHCHVNWLAPVKVRRTLIGGSRKMIVYDDVEPSEKVKVYDKGITVANTSESIYKMLVSYRSGDLWVPHLDQTEALRTEVAEFRRCIETGATPITDGIAGLNTVQLLEAATHSIRNRGVLVDIPANAMVAA